MYRVYKTTHGEFKSFQTLPREFALPTSHIFYYQQISAYLRSCCGSQTDPLQQSFIDIVLRKGDYSISSIHSYLIMHQLDKYQLAPFQKWSTIFNDNTLPEKILEGYRRINKLTILESWHETQIKIIHRAYYPFRINKADSTQAQCPWCSLSRPTLLHCL